MANATQIYKQADAMNALKHEVQRMMEDQKKMLDQNRQEDTSSEESSDDGIHKANQFTFISAIDVGSHFIDVNPSEELQFQNLDGNLFSQFMISNPCKNCAIAFYVFTSSPIPVKILPNAGFIPAEFSQDVKIVWDSQHNPSQERLENAMFFVKSLPLSPDMNVSYIIKLI